MATQEYYIREASENEARGPFNMEQLVSLAETGQVTVDTLWYDPAIEDWAVIGTNDDLKGMLFPEKRKLRMKVKEIIPQSKKEDNLAPITVEDMLAGAEGRTAETKDKVDPSIMQGHAARIGMWVDERQFYPQTPDVFWPNDHAWHAATGYKGDVLGELALLAFTCAQNWNTAIAMSIVAAVFKGLGGTDAQLIVDGYRRGRAAAWLPAQDWESLLALPVDEVRARLRLGAPAVYTPVRTAELRAEGVI